VSSKGIRRYPVKCRPYGHQRVRAFVSYCPFWFEKTLKGDS